MQLEEFLELSADRFPDKVALVAGAPRLTYRVLEEQANRLAYSLMELGVERGDRVAIYLENSVEAVLSIFATLKAGGVFLVVNPSTKADKLAYILNNCRAKCIVCPQMRLKGLQSHAGRLPYTTLAFVTGQLPEEGQQGSLNVVSFQQCLAENKPCRRPRKQNIDVDLAALIYTSGSTGNPKGVMLTHLNMVSAATSITTYLENRQDDIILSVLPLAFDYGLYQVLMGFKMGGTVVLERSFAYPHAVLEKVKQEKVTGFPIVPTIAALLLQMDLSKYDFSSLRYLTNTAAALPTHHIAKLRSLFPQARLFSMYGLTECKRVSYLPPDQLDIRPGSVGRGMPNEEVYIVDDEGNRVGPGVVGQLVVRGSNVMKGYWEMPEATDRVLQPGPVPGERVLYTGDLFRMDEESFLFFVGRKDDIIKSRGEKVSPKEVENVLSSLEGVAEAAVLGVPDEILGQAIKAFIQVKEGIVLTEKDVLRHCSRHLEDFMMPKIIEFRAVLPKTANGKISKRELGVCAP
jgi:amino acid adenylation domain-containing protein